ncbi:hypothetical protein PPEP_a0746 [Pseudoalteromonas peptidolytica F12-50-A1]|uniref:Uncharacterized protein n=1 Tax=Pseudoalteromonas peptidolytica F12-50-A1 TaxID=1315280 RepID=A0A8I0MUM7_9GAMM|nr:hypothetical protein [Pseudoalteromonas peptidolytica F12-50-A1]
MSTKNSVKLLFKHCREKSAIQYLIINNQDIHEGLILL